MNKRFNKFNNLVIRSDNAIVLNKFNNDEMTKALNISKSISGNANKYGTRSARLKIHNGNVSNLCNNPGRRFMMKLKILSPSNKPNANNLKILGIICPKRFDNNVAGIATNNERPKLINLLNNPNPSNNGIANNNNGISNNGRSGINGNNDNNNVKIGINNKLMTNGINANAINVLVNVINPKTMLRTNGTNGNNNGRSNPKIGVNNEIPNILATKIGHNIPRTLKTNPSAVSNPENQNAIGMYVQSKINWIIQPMIGISPIH